MHMQPLEAGQSRRDRSQGRCGFPRERAASHPSL